LVLAAVALVILLVTNPSKPAWPASICDSAVIAAVRC
jgi:hypothetical protein